MAKEVSRRGAMRAGAGVLAAGALGAPMVHAQGSAGSLRFAFWDHWVPGANGALQQLAQRWGERNRVNMTLDFINTTGNQLQLTIAAQAQARSGHDGIFAAAVGSRHLCQPARALRRRDGAGWSASSAR